MIRNFRRFIPFQTFLTGVLSRKALFRSSLLHTSFPIVTLVLALFPLNDTVAEQNQAMVFHTAAAKNLTDHRRTYAYRLLELALEKTVADFGPYELKGIPELTPNRMHMINKTGSVENFFAKFTYDAELNDSSVYAAFPVEFGVMAYRVCFVAPEFLDTSNTIDALHKLQAYSIGQGTGWPDTPIMRYNGLKVHEVLKSSQLIAMTERGRFDFFCRGLTEPMIEINRYKGRFPLVLNQSFMLQYELPRFFYTNKSNQAAMVRVREGLKRSYADGSAQSLFKSLYQTHFDFINAEQRTVLTLSNPNLNAVDDSYKMYNLTPDTF